MMIIVLIIVIIIIIMIIIMIIMITMIIYIYYIHLYTDIDIGLFIWFPYLFGLHGSTASREETLAEKRRMKEQQEEKKLKAPRWALDPCGSGTSGTSGQLDFGDHHPETSS
jgi:hypothetical protein